MPQSSCPDAHRLADYLAGKLSNADMDLLDQHLENCDSCCAAAAGLDGKNASADVEIRRLLRTPGDFRLEDDPELLAALQAVLRHGTTPGSPGRPLEAPATTGEFEIIASLGQGGVGMPTTGEGLGPETTSVGANDHAGPAKPNPRVKTDRPPTGPVPATIGRYIVRRQLGTGGFGTVWLADDVDLRRQVAIKVPRQNRLSNEAGLASFLHEAQTAARLKHPAIVTIHDVGRLDEIGCFVVMEFIPGRSLADEIRVGRPAFERSATLMEQVADAVHYAHEQGLVHRDLKPANILLDTADKPRVVDFGLAIHEQYRPGRRGEVSGTPAYMAPEQVRGESHRLDGRTDVWSLGVVLYELLAGRRPFIAPAADFLFEEIQHRDPRPPRQIDDAVPVELERICLKCLAKRMTDRYATAADLAADLRHWRVGGVGADGLGEGGRPAPVVPKGLRSFDSHDADFFLQLLPGPTDREGLPESIRFWKTRAEESEPDRTFPVGVLYGPSGCGKSSLFKAGLLPRLAGHVATVFIEASAEGTEERLLGALRRAFGERDLPPETIDAGGTPTPGIEAGGTPTPQIEIEAGGTPTSQSQAGEAPAAKLVDAIAALRFQRSPPGGRKVLIVIDQFEQWLHAHRDDLETDLVSALRQCDGGRVQCVVMVRDDFWLAASRFMQAIEIPLLEGRNSKLVDLFDAPHARKVLALFGAAYGCMAQDSVGNALRGVPDSDSEGFRPPRNPGAPGEGVPYRAVAAPTHEQDQFMAAAVAELAEDGKVVPVRLALFAEMVKARPWEPATLKKIGGIAGVGAAFLEETFSASTSQPRHRRHQRAARGVLKSLLPETVTDIKGQRRTEAELLTASGYEDRPKEFEDLMRILDGELRLITPADEDGERGASAPCSDGVPALESTPNASQQRAHAPRSPADGDTARADADAASPAPRSALPVPRSFQLTHDYLVPSLRDWLTRKQRETRRGRAELRLAERAAAWAARPEPRNLPAWWELLAVEVFAHSSNHSSNRSPAERRVLRAARRRHGLRAAAAAAILVLAALAAYEIQGRADASSLVEQLLAADTPNVPPTVARLARRRRQAEPLLRAKLSEQRLDARQELHVSLALLSWDTSQLGPLRARLLAAEPRDLPVIRDALRAYRHEVVGPLWQVFGDPASEPSARLRSACALAAYDPESARWSAIAEGVAETLTAEDTRSAETWIEALRQVKGKLIAPLSSLFRDGGDGRAAQRSMAAAILPDYASDHPDVLADLSADSDPQAFGAFLKALKRDPEEASSHLEKVTAERAAVDWRDPPLNSAWEQPAQSVVERIELAAGIMEERFALCQMLSLDEFEPLAEALRPAGYRPSRIRPYVAGGHVLAAAMWQRDGGDWRMAIGLSANEVRARDRVLKAEGYAAVDVAGYAPAGGAADAKFAVVWVHSPEASRLEIESVTDRPQPLIEQQGYFTATLQRYGGPKGPYAMTWRLLSDGSKVISDLYESSYAGEAATDRLQIDVAIGAGDPKPLPRPDSAAQLEKAQEAVAAKPADLAARFELAKALFSAGNDQAAIDELSQLAEKRPYTVEIYQWRSQAYARLGRADEARADLKRYTALIEAPTSGPYLDAVVAARLGEAEAGMARLEAVVERHRENHYYLYNAACAYSVAAEVAADQHSERGEQDERADAYRNRAIELLGAAVEKGYDDFDHIRGEDDFIVLREMPAFQAILACGHFERRYAAVFQPGGKFTSIESHGLSPEAHLLRCRELIALGYRPVAIAAAEFPTGSGIRENSERALETPSPNPEILQNSATVTASVWHLPLVEPAEEDRVHRRRNYAATALMGLGRPEQVWRQLVHSTHPEARSWLIHRLAALGADPKPLVDRLFAARAGGPTAPNGGELDAILFDDDSSLRRALLLALGEFSGSQLAAIDRGRLVPKLLDLYRDDPDAGIHGAVGWLLRKWGQEAKLDELDDQANKEGQGAPSSSSRPARRWYVNGQGQTMVIVSGPLEFLMGSPASEPGHETDETLHRRRVGRSFAISAHEVTVEQLERSRAGSSRKSKHARTGRCPVNLVTWYEAAEYCNWLSESEGIDRAEWCYERNKEEKYAQGMKAADDYLSRRGYRLPSEAEWECAARAGAATSRFYGASDALLGHYASYTKNSHNERLAEVGVFKPNDLGLFDVLGNVMEWCSERSLLKPYTRLDVAAEDARDARPVLDADRRALRGWGFNNVAADLRSASRRSNIPGTLQANYGFRVARTVP